MIPLSFLLGSPEERDWMLDARCRGMDPALFFPDESQHDWYRHVAEAQTICLICPVKKDCLEWSLKRGENMGVWGGESERERRKIKRARAKRKKGKR